MVCISGNQYYEADIVSAQDYYPFGMLMPGRTYSSEAYKYGFNGKEKDDEVSNQGNCYDYGFRIYNSRIGKFLSVDPLFKSYAWYTPYQFAGNKPIMAIDLDGLEDYVVTISELDKGIVMIKVDFIYTEKANNEKTNKPVIEKVKDEATPSLGTGGIEYRYSDGTKVRKSNFDPGSPEAVIMSLEKSYRDINGNVKVGTRKDYLGNKDVESEYIQSAEVLFVTTIAEYDNNSSKMKTELDLLDEVADRIKNKRGNVLLVGHTDKDPVLKNISPDDPDGNKKLSLQRAENVRSALVKKGADLAKIKIFGAGSLKADRTKKNPSDRKVIAIDYKE